MNLDPILAWQLLGAVWMLVLGCVAGSFANVCIHRIPWQKSILWPASHCPTCWRPVAARDNVPVLAWLWLGGRCRRCREPISIRYPLIELLVGLLFLAVYGAEVARDPRGFDGPAMVRVGYHALLVAFLVVATFIDYDLQVIPDAVTVPGMVLGLVLGALLPGARPEPAAAGPGWPALGVGLLGWAVGGGTVWAVRIVAGVIFRREAMGFGDVTLMALIGSFLGWQAAVLTFFLAPFLGLAHAAWRLARLVARRLAGRPIRGSDREIPYGPYLSLAAVALVLAWGSIWDGWARNLFATLADLIGWATGAAPPA